MLLELSKIMDHPGQSIAFETSLDLSDLTFGGSNPVTEPVRAKGRVRNTAGVLELSAVVETTLHGICDRCTEPFTRNVSYDVHAVLTECIQSDDFEDPWVFELVDRKADLDDIFTTAFVLNMDQKLLCREDCKGYCFRCGANLNKKPCTCKKEVDPRLAVLQQLLKKE